MKCVALPSEFELTADDASHDAGWQKLFWN
jgi:hypothetical protein